MVWTIATCCDVAFPLLTVVLHAHAQQSRQAMQTRQVWLCELTLPGCASRAWPGGVDTCMVNKPSQLCDVGLLDT